MQFVFAMLLLIQSAILLGTFNASKEYHLTGTAQGTSFSIRYISTDTLDRTCILQVFKEIDSSLSLYSANSTLSAFNTSSVGLMPDRHLRTLVEISLAMNKATGQCFDITTRSISLLWGFTTPDSKSHPPSRYKLQQALNLVGYDKVYLKGDSLFKTAPNVQLDLDGIAQGYTVDLLAGVLAQKGIQNFLIELGGEVTSRGRKKDGSSWTVTLSECLEVAGNKLNGICNLKLNNRSVTTSGKLSKYRKIRDRYVSHIIDPRSGFPVDNGILSVSVFAENAVTADGLDNALMVMGLEKAFDFLKARPGIDAYFVYVDKTGALKDTATVPLVQLAASH